MSDRAAFIDLCRKGTPDPGWTAELRALYHFARDEWDTAHEIVQDAESGNQARVHALLHRAEGDLSNARYWYRAAGEPPHSGSLTEERDELIERFLDRQRL